MGEREAAPGIFVLKQANVKLTDISVYGRAWAYFYLSCPHLSKVLNTYRMYVPMHKMYIQ
jgi:hypothetical protein